MLRRICPEPTLAIVSRTEKRRSPRHILGASAEVHLGPVTIMGVVQDVSRHGMGLLLPKGLSIKSGDLVMVLVQAVADYAITGVIRRVQADGWIGIELDEVLDGVTLERVEQLPLVDDGLFDQPSPSEDLEP